MELLRDTYGRTFTYLRLSITEACNFRCQYCLPNGYRPSLSAVGENQEGFLNLSEIRNLVSGVVRLGVRKIRLTGGEPTLRSDLLPIIEAIASFPEITSIGLTTNGYRLSNLAPKLKLAGVTSLNLSLDSLNAQRFQQITGSRLFERVRSSLDIALEAGFRSVKVNAVLLRTGLPEELPEFLKLVQTAPVTVRFIELMQTGENEAYFNTEHQSSAFFCSMMEGLGWTPTERGPDDGPAQEYSHPNYLGRVGVIAPYSKDFCKTCNRLRVTGRGELKLCLFGNGQHSLRELLQSEAQQPELSKLIVRLVQGKPEAHRLLVGDFGSTSHLASIGG